MTDADHRLPEHLVVLSHGVRVEIECADADLRALLPAILPPGWVGTDEFPEDGHLSVMTPRPGLYDVFLNGSLVVSAVQADVALQVLDAQLRSVIAVAAPDHIFVHAGAVAHDGFALLLPGPSFAGKSTLTAALVGAGALYLSDEFALLDAQGQVHPYPRPLSLRGAADRHGTPTSVQELGGRTADHAFPVGLVAALTWDADAGWTIERVGPGRTALLLLENTVPARTRPEQALEAISAAARGADGVVGTRGDADDAAHRLITLMAEIAAR